MKSTFKVIFYARKNYVDKNGEVGIMVRISLDGQRTQFTSKQKIALELWDTKGNKVLGKSAKAKLVNEELDDIKGSLKFHYREFVKHETYVTVEMIRDAFLGVTLKTQKLLVVYKKHNDDLTKRIDNGISASVVDKYERTRTRLASFIKHQYGTDDISLKEINYNFIYNFETYLRTVCNCGTNTSSKYLQRFKRVISLAKNNGWIQSDPFMNYKIKFSKVDRGYLTQEELNIIMSKSFTIKRLELVKDIFLFSCFTGLAYVDVRNLNSKDIKTSFDGKLWIIKKRKKTGVQSNILLLDIPKMILEKYKGKVADDKLLPVISNQRMNSYLKEIGDLCNIEKNLTFHLARHTFATTITLSKGVPIETISKMLGHTNLKTTQIYARITDQKIGNDMQELSKKLEGMDNILTI